MKRESNREGGFHYAWVILIVAMMVLGVYVPVVNSLSNTWQIAVTEDLGFSRTAFSFTGTITQAVGIFLGPVVSVFLTKYNFKRIWTAAAIAFAAAVFGYSLAQNQYQFYALGLVVGAAYITTAQIPMMMLINNWFSEKKGLATSIAVSGISAGGALLSPLVNSLIANVGWRMSYRVYALIILALAVVFGIFLIYLRPEDKGMKPYGYKESDDLPADPTKDTNKSLNVGLSIAASLSCSFFIFLLLGSVMNGLANGASLQFPPALQEAAGFKTAGTVVSIYLLLGVFGKLLLGRIADKYGIYHALFFGAATLALSFVAMLFVPFAWGPWLVAVVFGFGLALGSVLPPLVTASIYGRDMYGEAYGFVQSATQVGAAFGPLLVSYIFDASGSYYMAWIINIGFALLIAFLWLLAHKKAEPFAGKTEK
ncbi:MFS transporter [Peptoniphilus sp. EMRHCC_23]|uniref:MFS transporter n=1 Tax=Peptoniphilus rachelemmaiella TaxID=2811779 RepID=UPI001C002BED|nr:MFS transporter [Peptoniphilus rachelemmaiella]